MKAPIRFALIIILYFDAIKMPHKADTFHVTFRITYHTTLIGLLGGDYISKVLFTSEQPKTNEMALAFVALGTERNVLVC